MVTISKQEIADIAKKVIENVEQKHAIPSEVNNVRHGEYTYLNCKIIVANGLKDLPRKGVSTAPSPLGDVIHNAKIWRSAYLDMCRRLIAFVDENGHLPNYISLNSKKVHMHLYEYAFAKIVNYMTEHNTEPNYVTVSSNVFDKTNKTTIKKYGHATKSGCDNMGQNNGYYCGCHSLQEVFRNLTGIVVPQSTIAGWCGTTTSGTGHSGLETGVAKFNKTYGKNLKVAWKNFSDLGWTGIKNIINSNNQDCIVHSLYRSTWGHYEVVNGVGDTINVQNSLGSTCSQGCYCGYIEYRSKGTFQSYIQGISQKSVLIVTNGGKQ